MSPPRSTFYKSRRRETFMRKLPNWVLPAAIFAAAFALVFNYGGSGPAPLPSHATQIVWSHGHDGTAENAQEHWEKHRGDFPELGSAAEYESAAAAFVAHPPLGTLIKHRADGDTLLYDPATNTFAVSDAAGEPRTFFRPESRRTYWDRQ
jgi:pyocin large subunit-like protein